MEVDQAKDPKSMSLDDLIKQDKSKKQGKGGKGKTERPNTAKSGAGKKGPQGGRPRFENMKGKNGGRNDLFRAKKTGNMISKTNERTVQFKKKMYNKDLARSGKGLGEAPRRNLKVSAFFSFVSFLTNNLGKKYF